MNTSEHMKNLLLSPKAEIVASVWEDIEPILLAQQRALSSKPEGCSTDEMKGFTVAYNLLETFAVEGKRREVESSKKYQTTK